MIDDEWLVRKAVRSVLETAGSWMQQMASAGFELFDELLTVVREVCDNS